MSGIETPTKGERWTYKNGRGYGRFEVASVNDDRVTLYNPAKSKRKTISLRTLRGDYERYA